MDAPEVAGKSAFIVCYATMLEIAFLAAVLKSLCEYPSLTRLTALSLVRGKCGTSF